MSIKKELLDELSCEQLKELANNKGINFILNKTQREYYKGWNEKERLVDLINDKECIGVKEIENYIRVCKNGT